MRSTWKVQAFEKLARKKSSNFKVKLFWLAKNKQKCKGKFSFVVLVCWSVITDQSKKNWYCSDSGTNSKTYENRDACQMIC